MSYADATKQYQRISLQTASREQLLLTLYDTAVQESSLAAEAIRIGDTGARTGHIHRVSLILTELIGALDHDIAPEICMRLLEIYLYMKRRLADADSSADAAAVEEVARLLDGLREAWRRAAVLKGEM